MLMLVMAFIQSKIDQRSRQENNNKENDEKYFTKLHMDSKSDSTQNLKNHTECSAFGSYAGKQSLGEIELSMTFAARKSYKIETFCGHLDHAKNKNMHGTGNMLILCLPIFVALYLTTK